jgi:hypothetical protein
MQRTADFQHQVTDAGRPEAAAVVDDTAALGAAVPLRAADTPAGKAPMGGVLRTCEGAPPRLLRRHDHFDLRQRQRQQAARLEEPAARGQGIRGPLGKPRIVGAAGIGRTTPEQREGRVDQPHVLPRVVRCLAAIPARWLSRILGALAAPCGPVMPTRGQAGAGSPVGSATAAAVA